MTVRQLMMHRAGLCALEKPLTENELVFDDANGSKLSKVLAEQPLNWPVAKDSFGEQSNDVAQVQAYHAITRGL